MPSGTLDQYNRMMPADDNESPQANRFPTKSTVDLREELLETGSDEEQ